MAGTKRRSTRQAAGRKRSIYAEPETDDDFEANSEEEYQPAELQAPTPKKRKITPRGHKPQTRSKAKSKQHTLRSTFRVGKPRKPNSKAAPEKKKKGFSGLTDNKIPDWLSLPVNILRDIFVFASQPTHEDTAEARANVTWLLRTARTCRTFALPALEAFYNSPATHSTVHPHDLLDTLRLRSLRLGSYIDYSVKVRRLSIDVKFLAYVAAGRHPFDLVPLVKNTTQLQEMEIIHPMYKPPYRPVKLQRWTFSPQELIDAMSERQIRLKSWRWSRDMIPKNAFLDLYGTIMTAHQSKAFEGLTRLVVCGFNYEDSSEPIADPTNELSNEPTTPLPGLATSIAALPSLQDLTFISCDVIMDKFLQRLPTNLQRLELSNCLEITSDMLRAFFRSSGSNLRELVLNHNAALNLSFLCSLKELCPRLESLKVDLHYYSEKVVVNDAEALYDELLSASETPTWPSTLRHLEILHAQKWSSEAAENLFRSLLDSAADLPDLRSLILHAHVDIPWRDRVGFRERWIERLQRVYLRQPEDPVDYLGSLKQFRLWKQMDKADVDDDVDELSRGHDDESDRPVSRQLSHVLVSPHKPSGNTQRYSDPDSDDEPIVTKKRQPRRSTRVAETQISRTSKSATPAVESEPEEESDDQDWRKQPEKFIQGLCNVDVRIDNMRPRENQWTEGDFLDSEVSGDEDWHEGSDSGPEETYAW